MQSLGGAWSILGKTRVGNGSHRAGLGDGAGCPTLLLVPDHPGANLPMEDVRLPEASNKNVHIEQPDTHSLSSSIFSACSSVTISASSPGKKTKKCPSFRTGVLCFDPRITKNEVASPRERARAAAYSLTCSSASSLMLRVVLICGDSEYSSIV